MRDKGIDIEVLADNPDVFEQWRLLSQEPDKAHLVAYSDRRDYEWFLINPALYKYLQ